ncbi:maltotransferase domain-containing protein, partial [Streptomyces sp. NPDC001500]
MPARHHPSSPPTPRTENGRNAGNGPQDKDSKTAKSGKSKSGKTARSGKDSKRAKGGKAAKGPKSVAAGEPVEQAGKAGTAPDVERTTGAHATAVGRIPVLDVRPLVQQGRRPAKAVVGETFEISATVFREGHDAVAANVVLRGPDGTPGPWTPMRELAPGTDRWGADVTPDATGRWTYTVEAWGDPVATWRHHARIKIPAGMDTEAVLEEGARLYERAAAGVPDGPDRAAVLTAAEALRDESRPAVARLAAALTPEVDAVLERCPLRELVTASEPLPLLVERERALYGSWYEFFPRSEGTPERPHGTFRTAARRLPAIAEMGFDVVYLPPIHPIGTTFRKGRNNTLDPGPDDVGVPWAIGSPEGGHDAVHPDLGTPEDF